MAPAELWLQHIAAGRLAEAEAIVFANQARWTPEQLAQYRLVFLQGLRSHGAWADARARMLAWEPLFPASARKALLWAWLAQDLQRHGEPELALHYGRQALALNDHLHAGQPQSGPGAVSVSLFGGLPKYCETALLNAERLPQVYPGATLLVFHDASVPAEVLARLAALPQVQLRDVAALGAAHMPGTFWRFLALEEPPWAWVLLRDADSLLGEREQALVQRWLARPDKPFHVLRDWYTHTDLMLAGLWGARGPWLRGIRALIDAYLQRHTELHATHADQAFLAECVWPLIKPLCLHHDSLFQTPGSEWPSELPRPSVATQALGGVDMVSFQAGHWPGGAELQVHEGERMLCRYRLPPGPATFELPALYAQRAREGRYRLAVRPLAVVQETGASGTTAQRQQPC